MSAVDADAQRSSYQTEVWKPKYDLREADIKQAVMEPPPSHQSIQALLQRSSQKFSDEIAVTVTVHGIYGVPDEWTAKIDDPSE